MRDLRSIIVSSGRHRIRRRRLPGGSATFRVDTVRPAPRGLTLKASAGIKVAENFDIDGIFKSTFIREAVMLRRVYSFQYDEFGFYCHLNPEEFWRQVELNRKR